MSFSSNIFDGRCLRGMPLPRWVIASPAKRKMQQSGERVPAFSPVTSAAFSPDGRYIIGGMDWGTLRLWDVRLEQELYSTLAHDKTVNDCLWSPDGRHFVSGSSDATIMIWEFVRDVGFFRPVKTLSSPGHTVAALALSPNGRYIASASHDRVSGKTK